TVIAIAGSYGLHQLQRFFWSEEHKPLCRPDVPLTVTALVLAVVLALFPTSAFIEDEPEPDFYIIPRQESMFVTPPVVTSKASENPVRNAPIPAFAGCTSPAPFPPPSV
ncbi:MAG: hypothetical protein U9R74_08270, partial [Pseudomonadota bacterium]|nr:hypothetical protein [Pseudomonadota bacterium]